MFDIQFLDRANAASQPEGAQAGVKWNVERLTWRAVGGPWSAWLIARPAGSIAGQQQAALWALTNLVRCGVQVRDQGGLAWWGYVSTVSIISRGWVSRVSVDQMTNRVAVVFNELSPNPYTGPLTFSSWVENAESVLQYGRKVGVYNIGGASSTDAERAAAGKLAECGLPVATVAPAAEGGMYAVVECRGWWETLDWEYYEDALGWEGNIPSGTAQNVGDVAGNTKAAQSFTPSSSWPLVEVWLRARRFRAGDNLVVQVTDNGAGVPGAGVLGTATVAGALLPEESGWYKARLAAPVDLAAGTTYWIVLSRSGAVSLADYYVIGVDEKLSYASGVLRLWNGAAWVARVPDADMGFILVGEDETGSLIDRMVKAGQFFSETQLEDETYRQGRIMRDGSKRIREEVETLMRDGDVYGQRFLANVEPDRVVRIFRQPWRGEWSTGEEPARLGPGGYLTGPGGHALEGSSQPWGKWIPLGEAAGPGGALGVSLVFADGVIYDGQGLRLGEV